MRRLVTFVFGAYIWYRGSSTTMFLSCINGRVCPTYKKNKIGHFIAATAESISCSTKCPKPPQANSCIVRPRCILASPGFDSFFFRFPHFPFAFQSLLFASLSHPHTDRQKMITPLPPAATAVIARHTLRASAIASRWSTSSVRCLHASSLRPTQSHLNPDTDVKPHFRRASVDHPLYKDKDEEGRPGMC